MSLWRLCDRVAVQLGALCVDVSLASMSLYSVRPFWPSMSTLWSALDCPIGRSFLDSLTSTGRWVNVYYQRRPNLRDETDNHLVELALAGGAAAIVTHNVRDLRSGELLFPALRVLTPAEFLKEFPCPP
jgi:PIN domain